MKRILIPFVLVSLLVACDEQPEIRQYKIEKSRSDLGDIGMKPEMQIASASSPGVTKSELTRMVVAIAERDDATWFFKLTGPVAAIQESKQVWEKLLATLSFGDDAKPVWVTPDGWTMGPAKQFRYATLLSNVGEKGSVELSISSLAPNQDLLANTNRWRGQIGKPTIKQEQLKLETMKSDVGELKIFDETGSMASSSAPPMMPAEPKSELKYDVPEGWSKGSTNSIVKVRLRKGSDETAPQISVTQLLADANQWIPNAQRWARQVEMDDSEDAMSSMTEMVAIDSMEGQQIRLIPEDETKKYAMVGVMIVRDDLAWFFKLIGDRAKTIECESEFEDFLKSFHFE